MLKKIIYTAMSMLSAFLLFQQTAFAAEPGVINSGDTTFVLFSTALVFLMTIGLAFFYGGMVRRNNVLNTLMNTFFMIALISIQWIFFGYSLSFGPDKGGLIGGLQWLGLQGVGGAPNLAYAATIPHLAFMGYQMMFAIITPALITGAFAERIRFSALVIFVLLWSTLVYDPLAHWVWGVNGWLRNLGALDFAGGTVVHVSSGIAGLVAAIVIGKRKQYGAISMLPHNLPFVLLGAGLLWFGWFGFNAGSALSANEVAVYAFINTNTAAAAAVISWVFIEWIRYGKPTLLGAATGAVVGLVAITPAAGFVTPISAILIGLLVSPICYYAISIIKAKFGYDDSLDAFGCHGVGGIWGAIATGLFATKTVNAAGGNGLFYGDATQFGVQLLSVAVTIILSALLTFMILKIMQLFMPLRVSETDEEEGLDATQHGEEAYTDMSTEKGIQIPLY